MEALWDEPAPNKLMEHKWHTMLTLSLFLHVVVFSLILFIPESIPTRRIKGTVYEVNLVELPTKQPVKKGVSVKTKTGGSLPSPRKDTPVKRISRPKSKEKPVVIAKRTIKTQKKETKKEPVSSSKLIDQALSKIEKKVEADKEKTSRRLEEALSKIEKKVEDQEQNHLGRTISKLEAQKEGASADGFPGGSSVSGLTIEIYKREVEEWIKSNWAYPIALASPKSKDALEAIVLIKAKSDGTILKFSLKKESSNAIFNQSVIKAVKQSNPLPRFPPGYRVSREEFEITFNLSELEEY